MTDPKKTKREERERLYGPRYRVAVKSAECVYCGAQATAGDHVPPLAHASWATLKNGFWLYPVCALCNERLGAYALPCLTDRAKFLICSLRECWHATKAGKAKRFDLETVEGAGTAIKARLNVAAYAETCRCRKCEAAKGKDAGNDGLLPRNVRRNDTASMGRV